MELALREDDESLPSDAPDASDEEDDQEPAAPAAEQKAVLSADDQLALALLETEEHAKNVRNRSSTSFQHVWFLV